MKSPLAHLNEAIAGHQALPLELALSRRSASELKYTVHTLGEAELHTPNAQDIQVDQRLPGLRWWRRPHLHDARYSLQLENASIPAGSINPATFDRDGCLVAESLVHNPLQRGRITTIYSPLAFGKKRLRNCLKRWTVIDEGVLLATQFSSNYYHFLIDILGKLETVGMLARMGLIRDVPLLLPAGLPGFARQYVELLDLGPVLYLHDKIRVRKLHLPSLCRTVNFHRPSSIRHVRDSIVARVQAAGPLPPAVHDRIYISRQDASARANPAEAEVEAVFMRHGFAVVNMSRLTVRQQVELMLGCRVLAGFHGAGLTNLIFMPVPQVFELFGAPHDFLSFYMNLTSGLGGRYRGFAAYDTDTATMLRRLDAMLGETLPPADRPRPD